MLLRQIFDASLAQYAYLVGCQKTGEALIIDPERDVDRYRRLAAENGLRITAVAETHIHADFVSGARELAADPAVRLYLSGEGGADWSYQWPGDRKNVDYLKHDDVFHAGNIELRAVHTPGHTPEHLSFLITDRGGGATEPMGLATGDFLFVGDVGRPDLLETAAGQKGVMESSARTLRKSLVERTRDLPDYVQILPGHGAGSACGKSLGGTPISTLGYERRFNKAFRLALQDEAKFAKEILSGQPDPPLYFARMKRVNRDGIEVTGGVAHPPRLEPELVQRLSGEQGIRLLDLRSDRREFAEAHFPRSIHLPFGTPFYLAGAGSFVSDEEGLVLILDHAQKAEEAARQLYRIGLDRVAGYALVEELRRAGLLQARAERVMFDEWNPEHANNGSAVLDVRNRSEFEAGHIEDAVSIPYTRLRARLEEVPRGKRLFVHCGSGKRAALAASFLRAEDFPAVHLDGVCGECERIASERSIPH